MSIKKVMINEIPIWKFLKMDPILLFLGWYCQGWWYAWVCHQGTVYVLRKEASRSLQICWHCAHRGKYSGKSKWWTAWILFYAFNLCLTFPLLNSIWILILNWLFIMQALMNKLFEGVVWTQSWLKFHRLFWLDVFRFQTKFINESQRTQH